MPFLYSILCIFFWWNWRGLHPYKKFIRGKTLKQLQLQVQKNKKEKLKKQKKGEEKNEENRYNYNKLWLHR
jgi:hypothetical protein